MFSYVVVAIISAAIGATFFSRKPRTILESDSDTPVLPLNSEKKALFFFRKGMSNLLKVSGSKDVEIVFQHFTLLCDSIEEEIQRSNLDKDEFQKLLDQLIRPLMANLSAICLRLNKAHSIASQAKRSLKSLRTTFSTQRKYLESLVRKQIRYKKKKNTPKQEKIEVDKEIEISRSKIFGLESKIREEESKLEKANAHYRIIYAALDEIICTMHHDFLTCRRIQDALVLGLNLPESNTRKRIQEELDALLDTTKTEAMFMEHYEAMILESKENN